MAHYCSWVVVVLHRVGRVLVDVLPDCLEEIER